MTATEPPARRRNISLASLKITVIKVLIGKDEVEFNLNKHDVCTESEFFTSACKDDWSSGEEGVVRLVGDDPKIFVTWLITKDIEQAEDSIEVTSSDEQERIKEYCRQCAQLIRCFIMASALQAENSQNAVMDLIVLTSSISFKEGRRLVAGSLDVVEIVYINTIQGSPLRRQITDSMIAANISDISNFLPFSSEQWARDYTSEMMKSAITAAHNTTIKRPLEYPWAKDPCIYHEHRSQPEGYSCTKSKDGKKPEENNKRKR